MCPALLVGSNIFSIIEPLFGAHAMVEIVIKRVYEPPQKQDGTRVLVDRIWPRGISKEDLAADEWNKEVAPSTELRQWFAHDPEKWSEFRKRYLSELKNRKAQAQKLLSEARSERLTLLYAARDQ